MAQTVEVELELDSQGVVQSVNAAGESFERLDEAETDAAEGAEKYEDAAEGAAEASERQAQANRDAAQAAERNEQAQREAAQQAQRYAAASDRMAAGAGSANEVLFSTGDAIQDVQFGIAGAANNVAFIAENFAQLQRQAGSTKGAFSALTSSLTGTAGFILALQALLALGPQLAQWFSSREDEAEGLADALDSAAENLLSFQEDIRGFEVASLEDAKETRDILEQQLEIKRQELEQLERILDVRRGTGAQVAQMSRQERQRVLDLQERLGLEQASTTEIAKAAEEKQKEVNAAKSSVEQAENLITNRRAALALERALERARERGADLTREEAEGTEKMAAEAAEGLQTIRTMEEILASGPLAEGAQIQPPSLRAFQQAIPQARGSIGTINALISGLRANFDTSTGKARELVAVLQRMREEARGGRLEFDNLQQVVSGSLSSAFRQFGQAVAEGQSAMEALGQAAAGILSDIMRAIGTELIATGTAMLATGNPAGATYIAAGGTIMAASGALSAVASGGSGGGGAGSPGAGRESNVQGGGEATVNTDVPGRRMGGPVRAGGLYETHGLGRREFFVPATDGAIMTRGQARGRRMDVRQQTDVNLDVTEPDLFDLRAALNETSDIVEEKF